MASTMASPLLTTQMTDIANEILHLAAQLTPNLSEQAINNIKTKLITLAYNIETKEQSVSFECDIIDPYHILDANASFDPSIVSFAPGRAYPGSSNEIVCVTPVSNVNPQTYETYMDDEHDISHEITDKVYIEPEKSTSRTASIKTLNHFLNSTKIALKPFQDIERPHYVYIYAEQSIQIPLISIIPEPLLHNIYIMQHISANNRIRHNVRTLMGIWCLKWNMTFIDVIEEMICKFIDLSKWFGYVPENIKTNPGLLFRELEIYTKKQTHTIHQMTITIETDGYNQYGRWKEENNTYTQQIDLFANGTYVYKDGRSIKSVYFDDSISSIYYDPMCTAESEEYKTIYNGHCGIWNYDGSSLILQGYGYEDWSVDGVDYQEIIAQLFQLKQQQFKLEFNTHDEDTNISATIYFK